MIDGWLNHVSPLPMKRRRTIKMVPVLDVCCGGRMFWFDKHDGRAIYCDKRNESHQLKNKDRFEHITISPDVVADFTELPFPDKSFWHVVFDPPHRTTLTSESDSKTWLCRRYGRLLGDWKLMMRGGFSECFRVLKPNGTLIFKWCEYDVPLAEVLELTDQKPLYGHRSGNRGDTHWVAFLK